MKKIITRFAPSPTGYLHLGNLRSALFSFMFAKKNNGKFILRIDDTDKNRSKQIYIDAIMEDLNWLDINFDEKLKQSQRTDIYQKYALILEKKGLIYECFETEEELKNSDRIYNRKALNLTYKEKEKLKAEKAPSYWRFKLPDKSISWFDISKGQQNINSKNFSDPVIIKSDASFTYVFTSVIDDIETSVTHVIRGEDHISNTVVQKCIFDALDSEYIEFSHLPFLLDENGKSLSKRLDSISIKNLRQNGIVPNALNSFVLCLGLSKTELIEINEKNSNFFLDKYSRAMPKIILNNLYSLNSKACKELSLDLLNKYWKFFTKDELNLSSKQWDFIKCNVCSLDDVKIWKNIVKKWTIEDAKDNKNLVTKKFGNSALKVLIYLIDNTSKNHWDIETIDKIFKEIQKTTQIKGKTFFMTIRLALTGIEHGNDLKEFLLFIGYDEFLSRLNYVMES